MTQQQYDVAGLGNAIVDIIASVDDRFLLTHRIAKGAMTLIDEFRAKELLKALADNSQALSSLHEIAGGSAANTLAGLASLGGNGLLCRQGVRRPAGQCLRQIHVGAGRHLHHRSRARAGSTTASCLIAVTPDGQRSMSTYLGACRELTPDDVNEEQVARGRASSISKAICGTRKAPSRPRARRLRR